MSSCTPFINRTITQEGPCFQEGKSQRLKGNPNFRPSLSFSFFPTINIPPQMQRVQIWHFSRAHLPYLGDYVHFLSINGHNSNLNNRCMKRCTRTVWKPCSCYLVHSHGFYKEWADISRKCVAIVNHKHVVYWVNNYTKNETHGWKTWRLAWCHGMASPCPGKNWRMFFLCRDARLS